MEAVLQQALQCKLCAVHYDYGEHAPLVMPCGHTACLRCLQQLADSRCSECRQEFHFPLGKNFMCMNIMEVHAKEALTRRLEGVLPPGVQDQCSGEQALQALSLLQRDWELTLRGGERALTGTLRAGEDGDPLAAALCLLVATRTQLREDNLGAHQPAARAPSPTAPALAVIKVEPAEAPAPLAEAPNLAGAVPVIQPFRVEDAADLCGGFPSRVRLGLDAHRAGVMERIRSQGVRRLQNVKCGGDGVDSLDSKLDCSWALALLLSAAPTLVMLHVEGLQDVHLLAIHDMPRLRSLDARHLDVEAAPLALPALPPGRRGLQRLSMKDFPPGTALSLLRAHSGTLEALELETGPEVVCPPLGPLPYPCGELDKLRRGGGLPALRRLVLLRREGHRSGASCEAQCLAVERALSGPTVMCAVCDNACI